MSRKSRRNAEIQAERLEDPNWLYVNLFYAQQEVDAAIAYRDRLAVAGHRAGLDWGEIGRQIGMTRQGARKRFGGN